MCAVLENMFFVLSLLLPAKETVVWQSEEEKARRQRGVRVSYGRGDAKGTKLPERL